MLIEKSVYLAFYDLVILGEHGSDSGHSAKNQLFWQRKSVHDCAEGFATISQARIS